MDRHIELSILRKITNDFSNSSKIGSGGYGAVYKGDYQGKTIAVKLLRQMEGIDDKQYINELGNHKKVQHPNIVQLVGYCNIDDKRYYDPNSAGGPVLGSRIHRILCFEYMEGGSLEERLSKDSLGNDWRTHYKIIKGICQGLSCLHRASILHLDLKPANILLDKDMTAKISDFGLSRIFTGSRSQYMPPESILRGETSEKTDIFSLGVTIIDIMAGPQGYSNFSDHKVTKFTDEVRTYWTNKNMTAYLYEVEICIKIAIECVHCERNKRPTAEDILRNLNNMDSEAPSITQEDTITPAEEVPKAKKRKTVESASGEAKNKLGSNDNGEGTSMQDISSSGRGECTTQLDRRNFHPPENFSHSQPTNMTYLLRDSDRAISVTSGAMGSLLHKLGVLHKEFNLETSIEDDAEELVNMQQVLRKVSDVQHDNQLVKRWASNVREMSYNLEDFVDGFLVKRNPDSDASGVRELTHEMCLSLEKGKSLQPIGDLIKHHISKRVQDAAAKGRKYNIDNIVPNSFEKLAIDDLWNSAIYEQEDRLVGIRAQKDEVIGLFKEDGDVKNQELRIVSIVGLGGMGKTTLAKAVYDEFKGQYHTRAFLPVGRNPDMKNILKSVMYEIKKAFVPEKMSLHQLIKEVNELLENKRYFIVIDDIWDSSSWKLIRSAFPSNSHGSRVITTTRIHDVALATCNAESKYVYKIKPLSEEDSRILFFRRTFSHKGFPNTPRKEQISKYILETCAGMPLAINSIASLLTAGEPDSTWENVWKSLGALTEGKTERKTDIDNMKQILDLSYMYLPDDLKTCLLYVCNYPEDREIHKNDLLRQWVAEGFVSRKGRLDAEDVAENNFKALINMCMIEPGKIDYNDEVLSCRVHDIILELMRSKSSELNFIQVIDGLKDVSGPRGEIRRVSVQYNDKEDGRILETIKVSLSHARSVLLYRASSLIPDFLEYKYVRVLHIEDISDSHEPLDLTGISSLFLLRYLKIVRWSFCCGEWKLPDKIGQLQQLETIDLEGGILNFFPSDIVTLPRLSRLSFVSAMKGMILPNGIGKLKSIHILEGVCLAQSSEETIMGLGELTNLRDLWINSDFSSESVEVASAHMNAFYSSISRLSTSLRILNLKDEFVRHDLSSWSRTPFPQGSPIRKLHMYGFSFERCPEWIGQLRYLYSLRIDVTEVADGISIVGGLPSLAYFRLYVKNSNTEKEENVVIPGSIVGGLPSLAFQALKHLILECTSVCVLTFEERAMPKLEKLAIPFCYKIIRRLACMPVGVEHLPAPSLKEISLTVTAMWDNWKVKGSEHWNDRAWRKYRQSVHYQDKVKERARKTTTLLKRAFKSHHPSAYINVEFADCVYSYREDVDEENYEQDGDEEQGEDAYDDEDYYNDEDCYSSEEADESVDDEEADESVDDEDYYDDEDCYSSEEADESVDDEEADEGAYQENGSQASSQVQANTRLVELVELIEAQEDSDRMGIETDAPPVVDTEAHIAASILMSMVTTDEHYLQ